MSGGAWGYRDHRIREWAGEFTEESPYRKLLLALAETEHLADWAVCGDTLPADAARDIYQLWVDTFEELWG